MKNTKKLSLILALLFILLSFFTSSVTAESSDSSVYIVQQGDVLWKISQKYNLDWNVLARYNSLENPNLIYPGQKIRIPNSQNNENSQITIVMPDYTSGTDFPATLQYYTDFITKMSKRFQEKSGITVNIEKIAAEFYPQYLENRAKRLNEQNQPVLIFNGVWEECDNLIEQDIAMNIQNKIDNYSSLYNGFKGEYFVPIGAYNGNLTLRKELLEEIDVELPGYDWTNDDYLDIRDKWLEVTDMRYNFDEFWTIAKLLWMDLNIYDAKENKVRLDTPEVKNYINNVRKDIFSGKYILNDEYTCENYLNMHTNFRSKEFQETYKAYREDSDKHFLMSPYENRKNLLNSLDSNSIFEDPNKLVLPDIIEYGKINCWGFVVNKKSKNIDLGIDFIEYLLSDEIQLEIFELGLESSGMAPVIKTIEGKIEKIEKVKNISKEASDTRKYLLNELELGNYRVANFSSNESKEEQLKTKLIMESYKVIYADKAYTDEELSTFLQNLEEKLNSNFE